jgi:hypothetical protein
MEKAAKASIKNIRSHKFEKFLAVADPGNGDEFFSEVILPSNPCTLFFFLLIPHLLLYLLSISF